LIRISVTEVMHAHGTLNPSGADGTSKDTRVLDAIQVFLVHRLKVRQRIPGLFPVLLDDEGLPHSLRVLSVRVDEVGHKGRAT
jgi:hypothetical protein